MTQGWFAPMLLSVAVLAAVATILLVRSWPKTRGLSPEEVADLADAPLPVLARRAWLGLGIGGLALGVITVILFTQGAMTYWENDQLRLTVVGIFLAGLVGSALVNSSPMLTHRGVDALDERDRAVLARAPMAQTTLMILGLAAWMVSLTQKFHDEGAVPVVYLYLVFGSMILLMMIGQSVGILLGYKLQPYDAQS